MNMPLVMEKQFGFITKRSTILPLLRALDTWTIILDKNGKLDNICMDFMKAFDTVPHNRLLHKIHQYEIHSIVLNWIRGFLTHWTGRNQRVGIDGTYSSLAPVISGIPQGAVLGLTLFVLYIRRKQGVRSVEN